jgi:hypothetical protein
LDKLVTKNKAEALRKTEQADLLDQEAGDLLDEAQAAEKAAGNIRNLLGDNA